MKTSEQQAAVIALRWALAAMHFTVFGVTTARPYVVEEIKGYANFEGIMPSWGWGGVSLAICVGLILLRRGSIPLIVTQFFSAVVFTLFALLVTTGPSGLNFGTGVYGALGVLSFVVMGASATVWFDHQTWFHALRLRLRSHDARP